VEVLANRRIQDGKVKHVDSLVLKTKDINYFGWDASRKLKFEGVGILLAEKWVDSAVSVEMHSKRVTIVKLVLGERLVNVFPLHAPHSGKLDEKESFLNDVYKPQDEMVGLTCTTNIYNKLVQQ